MKAWYLSRNRFKKRIVKRWEKQGFKYNNGHVQLLDYAYNTIMFWSIMRSKKISDKNKPVGHPTLF